MKLSPCFHKYQVIKAKKFFFRILQNYLLFKFTFPCNKTLLCCFILSVSLMHNKAKNYFLHIIQTAISLVF